AAPAVGALLAATALIRRPIGGRAGRLLMIVVGLYGASIVVFGLSRTFALSLVALAVGGFVDLYSVNIRSTTVALVSPDPLRGRVNAVEMVFISASNELGAFESGLAASLVGTVPAVVGGGAVTIALALSWGRLFPSLARVDRLDELRPAQTPALSAADAGAST
ncbi:MAG: MFS transporter, partial [Solirubrobacteraceae bacterium]